MRRAILFLAITACASSARRSPGTPGPSVSFEVGALRSAYGINGTFSGSAALRDGWIDITIASSTLRMQQGDPEKYAALRVRMAVARCVDRNVAVVAESRAVEVAPLIGAAASRTDARDHTLSGPMSFSVAVPREVDARRAWLALVFEWPFENQLATYVLHTNASIAALRGEGGALPAVTAIGGESARCR